MTAAWQPSCSYFSILSITKNVKVYGFCLVSIWPNQYFGFCFLRTGHKGIKENFQTFYIPKQKRNKRNSYVANRHAKLRM